MSPRGRKQTDNSRSRRERALGKAVQKIEKKEAEQDAKSGHRGKPIQSPGRSIVDGWRGA